MHVQTVVNSSGDAHPTASVDAKVFTGDDDEPDWILAHAREQKRRTAIQRRSEQEARLAKIREKEQKARVRYESGEPPVKRQVSRNVQI